MIPRYKKIARRGYNLSIRLILLPANSEIMIVKAFKLAMIVQITTASISFFASLSIAMMILTSFGGLKSPYRRIIFGLSLSDVLQSFSLMVGPFAVSFDDPSPWSRGTDFTCSANGFLLMLGGAAIPMYTFALCYYYFCKLKRSMPDETFTRIIEWKIHLAIWFISFAGCISSLFTKSFHTDYYHGFCAFASVPAGCQRSPERYDECVGGTEYFYYSLYCIIVLATCLLGITISMSLICWRVIVRDKAFGPIEASSVTAENGPTSNIDRVTREDAEIVSSRRSRRLRRGVSTQQSARLRTRLRRAMLNQSCLYIVAYFATYSIIWVWLIYEQIADSNADSFLIPINLTYPLGGMFNILVFTRPSVAILRRSPSKRYSWLKAFALVVKAGGEVPSEYNASVDIRNSPDLSKSESSHADPSFVDQNISSFGVPTPDVSGGLALSSCLVSQSTEEIIFSTPGQRIFYKKTKGRVLRDY